MFHQPPLTVAPESYPTFWNPQSQASIPLPAPSTDDAYSDFVNATEEELPVASPQSSAPDLD